MTARVRSIGQVDRDPFDPRQQNSSCSLTYDGDGNLIQVEKTVGDCVYRRTLTWTAGNLTDVSEWVQV